MGSHSSRSPQAPLHLQQRDLALDSAVPEGQRRHAHQGQEHHAGDQGHVAAGEQRRTLRHWLRKWMSTAVGL